MQAGSLSEGAIPSNQSSATRRKITNESALMHDRPLFSNLRKWGTFSTANCIQQASLFTAIAPRSCMCAVGEVQPGSVHPLPHFALLLQLIQLTFVPLSLSPLSLPDIWSPRWASRRNL